MRHTPQTTVIAFGGLERASEVREASLEILALDDVEAMDGGVGRTFACTTTISMVSRGVRRQQKG